MSLFEQGPQICQIRVDTFGDDVTVAEPLQSQTTEGRVAAGWGP